MRYVLRGHRFSGHRSARDLLFSASLRNKLITFVAAVFLRIFGAHVYLLLPLYINQSITKKFPIEILLEMMDYSVKSLEEVEYA